MDENDFDVVNFPNGQLGYVPKGYGPMSQQAIARIGGGMQRGGGGAGTLGTFADGFEAVQQFMASGDMQRDLDDARAVTEELDQLRDAYAYAIDHNSSLPPGSVGGWTAGQVWKRIEVLQDRRDALQERIISNQIKVNYGAGLAAGGRVAGRLMGGGDSGGGLLGGDMNGSDALLLGVGGLGLYAVLRGRDSGRSNTPTPKRYI